VKWALHAPVTFDGQPLNLAEDPLEGVDNYVKFLNERAGGINGRKIEYRVFDDRYTVEGASGAAKAMVAYKPFFFSGTLGVDQVAIVAAEARQRGIPYMAAGGSEGPFRNICMFQIAASYDTHLSKLADYLGSEIKKQDSPYFGLTRVGVTMLDSKYIAPSVEDTFAKRLKENGLELVKVVTVIKPTQQTAYGTQIQALKGANVQILVPAQDPISTGRMTAECGATGQNCQWKWAMSNFAHESDTALQLQGVDWARTRVRGLSGGCYYMPSPVHDPYDTSKCGAMKQAHDEWVAVSSQSEWEKDGQGGASGYQIVHFWTKALRDIGADATRQRFFAVLLSYNNYSDLVSGPITFAGSSNLAHGATKMVPFEANPDNLKWRQLTPGFVDQF
jgi:ABC-type branched-subunit amino acid transport system substrate-binding protein